MEPTPAPRRPFLRGWIALGVAAALVLLVVVVVVTSGDDGGGVPVPTNTLPDDGTAAPTVDPGPDALPTVVIGDSGIAGGGARPYDPESGACFRSLASWPRQLQADLVESGAPVRIDLVEDRSCGGAQIQHLLRPWLDRKQPPQIPVSTPDPDVELVLLGIGGNDYGLGELAFTCFSVDCATATSPEAAERARTRLEERAAEIGERLVDDVYPALRTAYPNATIVQVGYGRPVPAPGEPVVECGWLTDGEPAVLAEAVTLLNDALEEAAERAGAAAQRAGDPPIAYVDVFDVVDGHELCSADPWAHPIGTPEQLHLNGEGYGAVAAAVAEALPDALGR